MASSEQIRQLDDAAAADSMQVDLMADMYNRMSSVCLEKCIPSQYMSTHMTKNEAVCQDRCVAKFCNIYNMIGEVIAKKTQENMEQMNQLQQQLSEQNKG